MLSYHIVLSVKTAKSVSILVEVVSEVEYDFRDAYLYDVVGDEGQTDASDSEGDENEEHKLVKLYGDSETHWHSL